MKYTFIILFIILFSISSTAQRDTLDYPTYIKVIKTDTLSERGYFVVKIHERDSLSRDSFITVINLAADSLLDSIYNIELGREQDFLFQKETAYRNFQRANSQWLRYYDRRRLIEEKITP